MHVYKWIIIILERILKAKMFIALNDSYFSKYPIRFIIQFSIFILQ